MNAPLPTQTTQAPETQSWPEGQTRPQAPQWLLSVSRSRQVPAQSVRPATQEVTQELEQWLARREAGGIIFSSRPTDDEVRRFFFHFARFRAPAETKNQFGALAAHLTADGITRLKLAPQPVRLEGVGQGVRGVATLWQ